MTILSELVALYETRASRSGWPILGFSSEQIGGEVVLAGDGQVLNIGSLMEPGTDGEMRPRTLSVPERKKRTNNIITNRLWDHAPYALGVDLPDATEKQKQSTQKKHAAFKSFHASLFKDATDKNLIAFARFCDRWTPDLFREVCEDRSLMLDQNFVFRFESGEYLHELDSALRAIEGVDKKADKAMCLVTGEYAPVERLHPPIKGVAGAQSSGASLVSFNNTAEESHGKKQGENAPTSAKAVSAYTIALNKLLEHGSGRSLTIGEATVVFWARATEGDVAGTEELAEDVLAEAFEAGEHDRDQNSERNLRDNLLMLAKGRVPEGTALDPRARIFVLGLSPNAARVAIRFWYRDSLGAFAGRFTQFWNECAIEPSPFRREGYLHHPHPQALLLDMAARQDKKNIPPNLGGDLMRAILTGRFYPATVLSGVIGRIRSEGGVRPDTDGVRAALIRAFLIRNHNREIPMAIDHTEQDVAYLLGRLFGTYCYAEKSYQERGASLRAKYLGAASATPARVFPVLMRGYEHNHASLVKAGGRSRAYALKAERAAEDIIGKLPGEMLPTTLRLEDQGRFFIGFYHQLSSFYEKSELTDEDSNDLSAEGENT